MTSFIRCWLTVIILLTFVSGCSSVSDKPVADFPDKDAIVANEDSEQQSQVDDVLMLDEITEPVHPFIASLPDDPYFSQRYPELFIEFEENYQKAVLFSQEQPGIAKNLFMELTESTA